MKKRIGTLYNKPIIEGDINLKTPNEIHKDELFSSNSQGGGDTSKIHYYGFDSSAIIKEFETIRVQGDSAVMIFNVFCAVGNSYIYNNDDGTARFHYIGMSPNIESMLDAERVEALLVDEDIYYGQYPYITKGDLHTKINYFIKSLAVGDPEYAETFKNYFDICIKHTIEITEDEFFGMCDLPITPLPE